VAILKDQPRSTSAIAGNRCVLLSLDKLEFLHLISYGNSNITGNSIDEEDRRFNDIISKYIGTALAPCLPCCGSGGIVGLAVPCACACTPCHHLHEVSYFSLVCSYALRPSP
jgi:hypothetical protein